MHIRIPRGAFQGRQPFRFRRGPVDFGSGDVIHQDLQARHAGGNPIHILQTEFFHQNVQSLVHRSQGFQVTPDCVAEKSAAAGSLPQANSDEPRIRR